MPPGFVGRARELAVLMESANSAKAGQPRFVLIEGEGGSGKTSLLRAFQEALSGAPMVLASGDEPEAGLRYGVLDELAREPRRASAPADRPAGSGRLPSDRYRRRVMGWKC